MSQLRWHFAWVCWIAFLWFGLGSLAPISTADASEPAARGHFALIDHEGRPVTDADFLGRYLLVFFGYTHCPDICPTDLSIMAQAMDLLGPPAEKVQPIFITLDPERDTAEVLKAYVAHFHPRLLGFTGSLNATKQVAILYRVQYRKVFSPHDADGKADYLLDHSAASYLIGPDGRGLSLYPHGMTAEDMAADMRRFID